MSYRQLSHATECMSTQKSQGAGHGIWVRQRPQRYHELAAGWRERLIEAVKNDRRTMNKISKDAGLSRNVVSQMINDHKDPGVPTLLRLCETLGVSPVWIILGRREDRYTEEFLQLLAGATPERRREIVNALRSLLPS